MTIVESLVASLDSSEWGARKDAAESLGKLRDLRAVDPLVQVLAGATQEKLEKTQISFYESVAVALGTIGDLRAVEPLIRCMRAYHWEIRKIATVALGMIGDGRALESLLDVMRSGDDVEYVTSALEKFSADSTIEPLVIILEDKKLHDSARRGAAYALGRLTDRRAVGPLLRVLETEAARYVRAEAANSLGRLGDSRAVTSLVTALNDKDRDVRESAAAALGNLGEMSALEPLTSSLKDKEHSVRISAAFSLAKLGTLALTTQATITRIVNESIDSEGRTSLMNAALSGNLDRVITLVALGADVNAKDRHGWTALGYSHVDNLGPGKGALSVNATKIRDILQSTGAGRPWTPVLDMSDKEKWGWLDNIQ